jgi:KUP system potassium uptake protein
MLTWRTGYQMLERQRTGMRQREDELVDWVLENPPLRLPGAAAIFTAGSSGIPLALTHHLRHNRVLHECVLLVSTVSSDEPRVDPDQPHQRVPKVFIFGVCADERFIKKDRGNARDA